MTLLRDDLPDAIRASDWYRALHDEAARLQTEEEACAAADAKRRDERAAELNKHKAATAKALRAGQAPPAAVDHRQELEYFRSWALATHQAKQDLRAELTEQMRAHASEIEQAYADEWREHVAKPTNAVAADVTDRLSAAVEVATRHATGLRRLRQITQTLRDRPVREISGPEDLLRLTATGGTLDAPHVAPPEFRSATVAPGPLFQPGDDEITVLDDGDDRDNPAPVTRFLAGRR